MAGTGTPHVCAEFYQLWEDRNYRSGDDLFSSLGRFRMICSGASAPVRIEGVIGNAFENQFNVRYGPSENCTPPNCSPDIDTVAPVNRINAQLSDNESFRELGESRMDINPGWSAGNQKPGATVGTHSLYVLPGSGCSGSNCNFTFYSPQPGAYYMFSATDDGYLSANQWGPSCDDTGTNCIYLWGSQSYPWSKGFWQLCPSGSFSDIVNWNSQYVYTVGRINHARFPAQRSCYDPNNTSAPSTQPATYNDPVYTCPSGQVLDTNNYSPPACLSCPAGQYINPATGRCHPAVGVTSPAGDSRGFLTVNFTRN